MDGIKSKNPLNRVQKSTKWRKQNEINLLGRMLS